MRHQSKSIWFCATVTFFIFLTVVTTVDSSAQTLTVGGQGHSFTTNSLGINNGPNPKRLALTRWYAAMNSSANFDADTGSTGIAFDGANIWVANRDGSNPALTSVITAHRANNGEKIIDINVYAGPHSCSGPVALAYDGQYMWCVCRDNTKVVIMSGIDGSFQATTPSSPGSQPVFIEFDGERMWVSNNGGNSLSIYNANPPYNLDYNPIGLSGPYGMASDGVNMWVANIVGTSVTVFSLADPSSSLTSYNIGSPSLDIAFDGANMWISNYANTGGSVYGITILRASDGSFVKKLTTTDGVGNKPTYMVFDGIYVWVVNEADGTISAFRASDFQHVNTVNAGGGGSDPHQIAFDGANIWIANSGFGTISKR